MKPNPHPLVDKSLNTGIKDLVGSAWSAKVTILPFTGGNAIYDCVSEVGVVAVDLLVLAHFLATLSY